MSILLQFLQAYPDAPRSVGSALASADFQVARLAARHGVSPLLWQQLSASGAETSPRFKEQLQRDTASVVAQVLRIRALLLEVLDALGELKISPLLLKGYGLAARLYGDPLLRPTSDIDLMVRARDFQIARQALKGLGMAQLSDDTRPEQLVDRHLPSSWGHHELWGIPGAPCVELHWRPIGAFGAALAAQDSFQRSGEAQLEGRSVRYLSPEDEVVYLAAHAAKHLLGRLSWLCDLKLLIRQSTGLNWKRVCQIALQSGLKVPVYLALQAAHRTLAADVPSFVLSQLQPAWWQCGLANRLFSETQLLSGASQTHRYYGYLSQLLFATGRAQMTAVARNLCNDGYHRLAHHHFPRAVRPLLQRFRN